MITANQPMMLYFRRQALQTREGCIAESQLRTLTLGLDMTSQHKEPHERIISKHWANAAKH